MTEAELLLQNIVSKAVPISEDADGFISRYEIPIGPIHRAIPYLDQRGIPRVTLVEDDEDEQENDDDLL